MTSTCPPPCASPVGSSPRWSPASARWRSPDRAQAAPLDYQRVDATGYGTGGAELVAGRFGTAQTLAWMLVRPGGVYFRAVGTNGAYTSLSNGSNAGTTHQMTVATYDPLKPPAQVAVRSGTANRLFVNVPGESTIMKTLPGVPSRVDMADLDGDTVGDAVVTNATGAVWPTTAQACRAAGRGGRDVLGARHRCRGGVDLGLRDRGRRWHLRPRSRGPREHGGPLHAHPQHRGVRLRRAGIPRRPGQPAARRDRRRRPRRPRRRRRVLLDGRAAGDVPELGHAHRAREPAGPRGHGRRDDHARRRPSRSATPARRRSSSPARRSRAPIRATSPSTRRRWTPARLRRCSRARPATST